MGTFAAGQLYQARDGWQWACLGAAALLLLGALAVRVAVRRVGVSEYPVEPPEPAAEHTADQDPKPLPREPESPPGDTPTRSSESGDARNARNVRNWVGHCVLFVVGQGALAVFGYSWPVEAVFGGPHEAEWIWNSSGHWLLNVSRVWTLIWLVDTVWTWGAVLLTRRARR
ncbi:hypothetical protein SAMN05421810_102651 [Amycolatopsis arida]|uniref:Uncharacterized protein n=1 Tax=Amycolatopsis arida TaxID=587909 RepID=A0A1I5QIV7_9PSEU|nr:hypothetical protein CLV69_101652 [Amycolatopsis arida]SFP46037.1 hypothetical protein SAMN05421810_102651 [Amycolatopsis arida]